MANAVDNGKKLDFIRIIGIGINNCSSMMMKMIWIILIVVGFGMSLPKALPWIKAFSENGKHYYEPNAHTDIIYTLGSFSISEKNLLTVVAGFGGVLVLTGLVGIVRK